MTSIHSSIIEAAAWRLCSEIARRHPGRLHVVELHPGGGQYDCLSVVSDLSGAGPRLDANRGGSIHVSSTSEPSESSLPWDDYLSTRDPREFILGLESSMRLTAPASVPPSTPATLTWRALAHVMAGDVLSVRQLRCSNGMLDTSGYGGGIRDDLFDALPPARDALREVQQEMDPDHAAYRFWFMQKGEDILLGVDSETGRCWWPDGSQHNVYDAYVTNGRRVAVAATMAMRPAFA